MCRLLLLVSAAALACTAEPPGGADTAASAGSSTGDPSEPDTATDSGAVPGGCPAGDVVLRSQDEVVALAGCEVVAGDLTIRGQVTDLAPLTGLRQVNGLLSVDGTDDWSSPVLPSLAGLEGLESVNGLRLSYLRVPSLAPLAGLAEIPGDLRVSALTESDSLEGLHNITSVGGELFVSLCEKVTDLNGLRGLQRVGAKIYIGQLPLADFHGLEALTEVGVLGGEPARLVFLGLPQLTSLEGLGVVWHESLALTLNRTGVVDLGVLAGVDALHDLRLVDNDALTDLAGLESLVAVEGWLKLGNNDGLIDISALAGLESVGKLSLEAATKVELASLSALTEVGELKVYHSELTDLDFPALTHVGRVSIEHTEHLTGLSGLAGLTSLGSLALVGNQMLTGLPDLTALAQVEGDLEFSDNQALGSLADLAALTEVGGRLVVVVNPELPQVDAETWGAAIAVGGGRKIGGNNGAGPPLDPCPWSGDDVCDEGPLCAVGSDGDDCSYR